MKAKKMILSLLAVAAMALTLTACNDDDNDTWEKATSAQIAAKATQIRSYLTTTGKFYYKGYNASKMDSLQNRLTLTMPEDTTIMVYNVPNSVFAAAVDSTTTDGLKLKHAILNATEKTTNLKIHLAYYYYTGDNSTYCFLTPQTVTLTIPYSSTTASDKITFSFWLNQYQAAWDVNKKLVLQGLFAGYTLNKGEFQQFANNNFPYFYVYCK